MEVIWIGLVLSEAFGRIIWADHLVGDLVRFGSSLFTLGPIPTHHYDDYYILII